VPTQDARRWAEEHRRHDCPRYGACLDDAARAQGDGRLGQGMTWRCGECE
jgi:hypothetical protein